MKVLLVQLPVPNNKLSNLPLALGYLKASAEAAKITGVEVEILERSAQDRGGDAFLLDAILRRDPDVVGFSLYTWNSTRALNLARSLKEAAPEIITLAGGPEVNRDGDFVLSAGRVLDFLVLGEGERTFVELLSLLNKGAKERSAARFAAIPGLAFHPDNSDEWQFNLPRLAIEDVNLLPSVYLSGALEGFLDRIMMIELSRWCPSKCTFCYYGRQDLPRGGKRHFDIERLRRELLFGMEHGVEQVHFVEANFNTLPHLNQIYQTIKETGANRKMRFYAEMRGEAVDEEEADKLVECNFGVVECGLQSAVPEVLAKVRRKNHLPRLIRGIHHLRERGVEVFLDAILGLPGDTPETFHQTLNFIEENDLAPYDLFHLQILPGTQLKAEALNGQHGLQWQPAPPYFALQTAELSFEQLCQLRRETLLRKGDDPDDIQGLPIPGPFSLVKSEVRSQKSEEGLLLQSFHPPIERVVIEPGTKNSELETRNLSRRLASEVTLWLRLGETTEEKLAEAAQVLTSLSAPNPGGVWHIFGEVERPLTKAERKQLLQAVRHEAGYLDRLAVFALNERDPEKFEEWPSIGLYEIVPWRPEFVEAAGPKTIWEVPLFVGETPEQWQARLEGAALGLGYGLFAHFPPALSVPKLRTLIDGLSLNGKILFPADLRLAAALASSQNEDAAPVAFPPTVQLDRTGLCLYEPAQEELDRAALRWALASRHSGVRS